VSRTGQQATDSRSRRQPDGRQCSKREQLLRAALVVIAEHGTRGVTHRAVAREAGVTPSLVTYYLGDIDALLLAAFTHFHDSARPGYAAFWERLFEDLDTLTQAELRRRSVREDVCRRLTDIAMAYLEQQVRDKPVELAVEQILFTNARLTGAVAELSSNHRQHLLEPLTALCRRFNASDPEIDAALLLDTLLWLEYGALQSGEQSLDREQATRLLRRQLGWILGLGRV
jgi:DNA-binding transcriptional regulator YbjK